MAEKKREYKQSNDIKHLDFIKREKYTYEDQMPPENKFKTKYGHDGLFVGFPSIGEYIDEMPEDGLNIYNELIPLQGFLPLYMDLDYYTTKEDPEPLKCLLELLYHYCRDNFEDYFKLKQYDIDLYTWKRWFLISSASRQCATRNMYKNSYHLKLMGPGYDWIKHPDNKHSICGKQPGVCIGPYIEFEDTELPIPYIHFKAQWDMKNFLNTCINNYAANHSDPNITKLYEAIHLVNDNTSECKCIVDNSIYKSNKAKHSTALRMLYNQKQWLDDESTLKPHTESPHILWENFDLDENDTKCMLQIIHSITAEHSRLNYEVLSLRSELIPCDHLAPFQETQKLPDTILNQTGYKMSLVPQEEEAKAMLLLTERLGEGTQIVATNVTYRNDYEFKIQSTSKCLVCHKTHPITHSSRHPYNFKMFKTPGTNRNRLYCMEQLEGQGKYKNLNPVQTGVITHWDYRHEDNQNVPHCVPIDSGQGPSKRYLEDGGTFFYEAPKGTGKTESMKQWLRTLDPSVSVLLLTYRVNLSNTYKQDLKPYGFTHYKEYHGGDVDGKAKQNKHRYIVVEDSIKKTVEILPEKQQSYVVNDKHFNNYMEEYDIIVIDEIYSCLEHWQSKLMGDNKLYAMMLFENHIKRCKKLVCLDAHLNNAMVINTINKLRDPAKFICYKNPNAHNMDDYKVYYTEQDYISPKHPVKDANGITMMDKFKDKIFDALKADKKIVVLSSTARFVKSINNWILDLQEQKTLPKFKTKLYTSESDPNVTAKDMSDVYNVFADPNLKLLLYSPTISAGISFNNVEVGEGFDIQFCCFQTGAHVPSLNTTKQMLRRVRQLRDKELHIIFDKVKDPYPIKLENIEKVLYEQSNDIHKHLGKPELCNQNNLDSCMRIKYDRTRWDYNVWKENAIHCIKYSNHDKYVEGLKQSLCNPPSHEVEPGYGMTWIDETKPFEMTKEQIAVSQENIKRRKDLETKADYELYEDYLELPILTEEEIQKLRFRRRSGDDKQMLNMTEQMVLRRADIMRQYGVDLELWKAEEDGDKMEKLVGYWKDMLRGVNLQQYVRQQLLIRAQQKLPSAPELIISDEIYTRAHRHYHQALNVLLMDLYERNKNHFKNIKAKTTYGLFDQLKDISCIDTPQIMESIYNSQLQKFPILFEIMNTIGINTIDIKPGMVIPHNKVTKLLKNPAEVVALQGKCYKNFPHLKFRKPGYLYDYEIAIRDSLQKWQLAHPDVHILTCKRGEVLEWLVNEGGLPKKLIGKFENKVDNLKPSDFNAVQVEGKIAGEDKGKTITPEILSKGGYWMTSMCEGHWEKCKEPKKLLGFLSKILCDMTGYICNEKQSTEKHSQFVIKNSELFKALEPYQVQVEDKYDYCLFDD